MAQILKPGDVVQLVGDLGAGKTQFVRGLAKGLGSEDEVASPSFTISREYRCPNDITLFHFDLYRLDEPGIMRDEIRECVGDSHSIVALEWADTVEEVLPEDHYFVRIKNGKLADERSIEISQNTHNAEETEG